MPWAVQSFYYKAEYKIIAKSCIRWCWPNQNCFMWLWQYNVFSSVWKYSVCCKCSLSPWLFLPGGFYWEERYSSCPLFLSFASRGKPCSLILGIGHSCRKLGTFHKSPAVLSVERKDAHIAPSTEYSSGLWSSAGLDSEKWILLCIA